jgi:hypothetical protein
MVWRPAGEFTDEIVKLNSVYGTHHIGASTDQAQEAIAAETVRIVRIFKETGKVPNVVNIAKATPATCVLVIRHLDRPGVLVVPLQNAQNKGLIDLLAAADTTGFRILYMIGDDPGKLEVSPGSWVFTNRPPGGENGAAIGAIDGADLTPLIALKDSIAIEIARVSRTPLSYFQISGQVAAEGSQKQQENGLLAKVASRQTSFGNSWEDVLKMARRLAALCPI